MGVNAGTIGTKEINKDYDALVVSDATKFIGHEQTLVAQEGSLVPRREGIGID